MMVIWNRNGLKKVPYYKEENNPEVSASEKAYPYTEKLVERRSRTNRKNIYRYHAAGTTGTLAPAERRIWSNNRQAAG